MIDRRINKDIIRLPKIRLDSVRTQITLIQLYRFLSWLEIIRLSKTSVRIVSKRVSRNNNNKYILLKTKLYNLITD